MLTPGILFIRLIAPLISPIAPLIVFSIMLITPLIPALMLSLIALAIAVPKFVNVFSIEFHNPLKNDTKF